MGAALEHPQAPGRHRLDVAAYYRMAEAGILSHPQRVELIDGDVFDMNPIGSRHAAVTRRLERLFARAVADGIVLVSIQNPLRLDAYNEPQPDFVALAPRSDAYAASHPGAADALILVEVSDSSLDHDRKTKLPVYARFGVPEVWIVDLSSGAVEVHRDLTDGRYASFGRLTQSSLTPIRIPQVTIDIAALLG
jgi:Uma2 family endonuclease